MRKTLCGALALLLAGAAFAQQPKPARNLAVGAANANEQRVALVIGNSAYQTAPLANPVNDAADIAKALQDAGFKIILKRNANTREMRQAIREFGAELRRAQVGLFYFAGHGVQVKGNNYLVPVGADIQSEADTEDLAVDANYVLRTMEEAQTKVSIVILDACRNNPFARSFRSAGAGLAQMNAATGSIVAFATAPGSVAADGGGRNGVYTKHLLASLQQQDTDILKVFQRTRANVVKETGGKQTPWESTSLIGDFYFRAPGGAVPSTGGVAPQPPADPATLELALWESVKDSRNADELRAYFEQYPNGRFAGVARARLKSLQGTQVAIVQPTTIVQPKPPVTAITGAQAGSSFRDCDDCPEMVVVPAGSFTMGSPGDERGRTDREGPQHRVSIPRNFAVGRFNITKAQYAAFVRETAYPTGDKCFFFNMNIQKFEERSGGWRDPSFVQTDNDPVVCVNWDDAKAYTAWLTRKTGKGYRLLTESEWEYAARAGTSGRRYWGENDKDSCLYANIADASWARVYRRGDGIAGLECTDGFAETAPVGRFKPNAFGLFDMLGNAVQWTEDCFNDNYNGAPTDGRAWTNGNCGLRVTRGVSWGANPEGTRSANRTRSPLASRGENLGFRVARTD